MKRFLSLVIYLTIIISCSTKDESVKVKNYKIDLSKDKLMSLNEILTFEKFIYLEKHPEALINHINRIYITKDGNILILDENTKKILLFSKDGEYIRNIGKEGKGPHEFYSPHDIAFDNINELIYVLTRSKKINVYDISGKFVKDINISIWGSSIYYFNDHLFIHNASTYGSFDKALLVINTDGKEEGEYIQLPNKKEEYNYLPRNNFCETHNELRIFSSFDYNIYSYFDNIVVPCYSFDFLKNSAPTNYISEIRSQEEFYNFITNSNYIHSITTFLELGDLIYLELVIQKKTYSVYFDKRSELYKIYNHRNLHDVFVQLTPLTVQNGRLVNVFYPHYRLSTGINYDFRIKYCKDKIEDEVWNQYVQLTHMDLDQNPVIILTMPKTSK